MILDGHVKEILAMDFAPNGYQVATGSGDDTVRIWDLRALKTQYIIPAHKSSVSDLHFFRSTAEQPFQPLTSASPTNGHTNGYAQNGMDVDAGVKASTGGEAASADADVDMKPSDPAGDAASEAGEATLAKSGLFLVTAGFDNTVRVWSADEWNLVRNLSTDSGKVMSVDVSGDGKFIASASFSRSFHLFGGDHSL